MENATLIGNFPNVHMFNVLRPLTGSSTSLDYLFCHCCKYVVLIITAILGNVLILIALQDSLLHSPSKMLFRYLTSTDSCVGLTKQPCFVTYLISEITGLLSVCYVTERLVGLLSFRGCYFLHLACFTLGTRTVSWLLFARLYCFSL